MCFSGLVAAGFIDWLHGPSPIPPRPYPLTHTPSHPYPGTMQTVSWKVAHSAVFWIGALQHEALPPGRVQQPRPPQLPHDLAQQMPPGPRMPWSHQVIGAAGGYEGGGGEFCGSTHAVASNVLHRTPALRILLGQHASRPPGKSAQPALSLQVPHESAQHTPFKPPRPQWP